MSPPLSEPTVIIRPALFGHVEMSATLLVLDTVDVWQVWLDHVSNPTPDALNAAERQRAARFRFDRDRRRYMAGRAAVRTILARYLDTDPGSVQLVAGPGGRPEIPGQADISISHSGGLLLLAVAHGFRVGVDVEALDQELEVASLAQRHLAPGEAAHILNMEIPESTLSFLRSWTLKEAVRKALGIGLAMDTRAWPVAIGPDGVASFSDDRDRPPGEWCMRSFQPASGYVAAVAATAGGPDLGRLSGAESMPPGNAPGGIS